MLSARHRGVQVLARMSSPGDGVEGAGSLEEIEGRGVKELHTRRIRIY